MRWPRNAPSRSRCECQGWLPSSGGGGGCEEGQILDVGGVWRRVVVLLKSYFIYSDCFTLDYTRTPTLADGYVQVLLPP